MLTLIKTDLVARELTIGKKKNTIYLNALQHVLSKTVEVYKDSLLYTAIFKNSLLHVLIISSYALLKRHRLLYRKK